MKTTTKQSKDSVNRARRLGVALCALALSGPVGCDDAPTGRDLAAGPTDRDDGPDVQRQFHVDAFGAALSFEVDSFALSPAPRVEHSGYLTLTPSTREIRAAVVVRDLAGLTPSLDELLSAGLAAPSLVLAFDDGTAVEVAGTPMLSQVAFDVSDVAFPPGVNATADVRIGGQTIGRGEVFHAAQVGDVDGDGAVDSSDLVSLFQDGLYETGLPATYEQGDFDGDGLFTSGDLVTVMQYGRYEAPPLPLPHDEELVVRNYPPSWLFSYEIVDELYEQMFAVEDAMYDAEDAGEPTAALQHKRDEILELIDELGFASSEPDLNYNNVDLLDYDGCAVVCWMSARQIGTPKWETERTPSDECHYIHDDDCSDFSVHEADPFATQCPPYSEHLQDGWLEGVHYQYNVCAGEDGDAVGTTATSDVTATCNQEVKLTMHCENFGNACEGQDDDAARCDYTEARWGEVDIGGSFRRDPDSELEPTVSVNGALKFASDIEDSFGITLSPSSVSLDGVGIKDFSTATDGEEDETDEECEDIFGTSLSGAVSFTCASEVVGGVSTDQGWKIKCSVSVGGTLTGSVDLKQAVKCAKQMWDAEEPADSGSLFAGGIVGDPVIRSREVTFGGIAHGISTGANLPLEPLGINLVNETHAVSATDETDPWFGQPQTVHRFGDTEAWGNAKVRARLSVAGPGTGPAVCMTARPAGLDPNELQDIFFTSDVPEGNLGHWWGSDLTLTCDRPGDMFAVAEELAVTCYDPDAGAKWQCASNQTCGAAAGDCD